MHRLSNEADPITIAAREKEEADAKIKPWQKELKKGSLFYYFSSTREITMWGEILDDPSDGVMFGYRNCRCYSPTHPEGIEGYLHVSVIHQVVSKPVFDLARHMKWPFDEMSFIEFAAQVDRLKSAN